MKKLFILASIVCLGASCIGFLGERSIYLSPPPDVLYDAAVIIVKDMGFTTTDELKEQSYYLLAEKKDEASGGKILIYLYFERKGVDTIARINISQRHLNEQNMGKLRDDIESRLRAVQK